MHSKYLGWELSKRGHNSKRRERKGILGAAQWKNQGVECSMQDRKEKIRRNTNTLGRFLTYLAGGGIHKGLQLKRKEVGETCELVQKEGRSRVQEKNSRGLRVEGRL